MFESFRNEYKASLKSYDTEEHIDLAFYRPIGFAWALLFRRLHISPNAVTIASIFIGVAAGICLFPSGMAVNIVGMALLMTANSLDSADGQLARLTKQYSRLGRILDGMAGDFWFISIYVSICLRTNATVPFFSGIPSLIWILAVTAGICHGRQAAMADYFRQFHLLFVKKDFPSELDSSATILRPYRSLTWRRLPRKLMLGVYYLYTRSQEKATPAMQRLLIRLHREYPSGKLPESLSEEIRRATLPCCKWENFLTFNWRYITLLLTVLAGNPFWYFIVELTLFNAVLLYLRIRHERICSALS